MAGPWEKYQDGPWSKYSDMDTKSGAPMRVRAAVGAAQTDADKIATGRKFYPDFDAMGPDNFAFTDPKTGRRTLANPKGFDVGDIVGAGPEIAELVGGFVTSVPGMAAAPVTGGGSLLTLPATMGLGAGAGREAYGLLAQGLLGTVDTRSTPQRVTDAAQTVAGNAIGARVGELGAKALQGAFGVARDAFNRPLRAPGAQAVADFRNIGIQRAPAGAVTGNTAIQMIEQGLANTPGGAGVLKAAADSVVADFEKAVKELSREYGPRKSIQEVGELLKTGAEASAGRFKARQAALYDDAFNKVGADTLVQPKAVYGFLSDVESQIAGAAQSRGPVLDPVRDRAMAILKDANNGLRFEDLRRIRTDIGRELDDPVLAGSSGARQDQLRKLYGALTQDIYEAANRSGPEAFEALQKADRYTKFNMQENIPLLQKIMDAKTDEAAFNLAMAGTKDGGSNLSKLRRNLKPDEWAAVSGTVLGRMGRAKPGQAGASSMYDDVSDFSVSTFLTNWNSLSPEAKRALFGGTRYSDLVDPLNALARSAERIRNSEKLSNPSGTARNLIVGGLLTVAGQDALQGDVQGAATTIAGGFLAPRVAAKLITNPDFVRWAVNGELAGQSVEGVARHLGRLAAVAKANPEIREELFQYYTALRSAPTATAPNAGRAEEGRRPTGL